MFKSPTRVALGGAFVLGQTFVVADLRQIIPSQNLCCQVDFLKSLTLNRQNFNNKKARIT